MPAPTPLPPPRLRRRDHAWRYTVVALVSSVLLITQVLELGTPLPDGTYSWDERAVMLLAVDVVIGLVTFPLVHLRRRYPLAVALVLSLAASVSSVAGGPATLATVSIFTRRRWLDVAVLALPNVLGAAVFAHLTSGEGEPLAFLLGFGVALYGAIVGCGFYIGARRDLVASLRLRAETAEREQLARVEQARDAERNRIAREMHDVLAHRMSVVAMYAGALGSREDLDPAEVRRAARVVEEGSRAALTDLREVLGVLRAARPEGAAEQEPPQPTLTALDALAAQERALGVDLTLRLPDGGAADGDSLLARLPDAVSRTAYRVVQEGLTNARKHAPGAPVEVSVAALPGEQVDLRVVNGTPSTSATRLPGAGLGLIGVRERAGLLGGGMSAGPSSGGFALHVWLPWRA